MEEMNAGAPLLVNIFDGTRKSFDPAKSVLITIKDGNQKQIVRDSYKNSSQDFRVPFYNNNGDNYTVVAAAGGYKDAGYTPIKVSPSVHQIVDLMLLPNKGKFNFAYKDGAALKKNDRDLYNLVAHGAANSSEADGRYNELLDSRPASLAALYNITTAMRQIHLPVGTPFAYLKELIWDKTMAQDRFFGYADAKLIDQVIRATDQGVFAPDPGAGIFHTGATRSWKQIQFGEANVQLTFHEEDTRTIDGVGCVKIEPDIDYYKDLAAHALLEVVANKLTGGLTDPKQVYVLRWIAGRHAGVPEFNPPYTIEA